jgi:hypothetical protein
MWAHLARTMADRKKSALARQRHEMLSVAWLPTLQLLCTRRIDPSDLRTLDFRSIKSFPLATPTKSPLCFDV